MDSAFPHCSAFFLSNISICSFSSEVSICFLNFLSFYFSLYVPGFPLQTVDSINRPFLCFQVIARFYKKTLKPLPIWLIPITLNSGVVEKASWIRHIAKDFYISVLENVLLLISISVLAGIWWELDGSISHITQLAG